MNRPVACCLAASLLLYVVGRAQGTFTYDQQSSVEGNYGPISWIFTTDLVQSFTPTLDSVGFIRIALDDSTPGNTMPGTIVVNLRSGSPTGPLLASTEPVLVPAGTRGPVNFYFDAPVALTPGTTYYFQPAVQSGNAWGCNMGPFNYAGGSASSGGFPTTDDLWFREGIVVPEPSAGLLLMVGVATLAWARRRSQSS